MRTWTLAIGMALSLSGAAFANQPDPAYESPGGGQAEKRALPAGNHQETRADRQVHDGRQETHGTSTSGTGGSTITRSQRSSHR
jgi:hypothetical protein